jgi:pimeloyl-ACP methyl ester carboxylesterase
MSKTIILIHGAWMTHSCWESFAHFLKKGGYRVLAPAWPYKEKPISEQRKNPDPRLGTLGIKEIVDHYAKIIEKEKEPPILIGHSFGGLFVQMLLDRGLGAAGIAIDPAPPKGIFSFYPSVIWSLRLPLLTPLAWRKVLHWPFKHFQYAFVNTMPLEAQRIAYDNFTVPESGRIFWQEALSPLINVARVNFKNNQRAPLLIIAGSKDHIVPAIINRSNFKKYRNLNAKTSFKEFPGRGHWIIAEPGWEEVAAYSQNWIESL